MMTRRFIISVFGAVALISSAALGAEPIGTPLDLDTGGSASCGAPQCLMSRIMATGVRGTNVSVAVLFDRTRLQPRELVIDVPATADQRAGVKYGFANPDGKTVRRPWGKEFSAPISSCEKDVCTARIEDDITLEGHNLQKDFLDNLQKYGAFVVSFQMGGEEINVAASSTLLVGDHELMLAESKKTGEGQSAGQRQVKGWDVQCRDKICTMTHFMRAEQSGKKVFVAAALQFDRTSGKPNSMILQVPKDADQEAGAEIAFLDPPDAPARRKTVVLSLPFAQCDQTSCIARAFSDASSPERDLQVKIVENALNYPVMAVGYHVAGERAVAFESNDLFKSDYQTLQAELKKPQ